MPDAWSPDNPAFEAFVFYTAVLGLKLIFMSPLTGFFRMSRGAFSNPEDTKFGGKNKTDPDVERVRRAHQNDLENILPFFVLASMFLLTNPSIFLAKMLFRVFTFCRILHTIVYLKGSNLRPLFYLVPFAINVYMAVCVVMKFW